MVKGFKKEYLILVVIIAALSAYLLLRPSDRTSYDLPQMEALDADAITKIEIKGPQKTIVLEKIKKKWLIMPQKYRVAVENSRKMTNALKDFKITALISEARAYNRYGLSDNKKYVIKAFAGDDLKRHFELGKQSPSFNQAFIKLVNDHRVYQSGQNLRRIFEKDLDDLRNKSIFSVAATDVTELSVTKGGATIHFKRKLSQPKPAAKKDDKNDIRSEMAKVTWLNPGGPDGDPAKIDKLIKTLSDLKAASFIYDKKKSDYQKPAYSLTVKSPNSLTLSLFERDDGKTKEDLPAVSSASADPFFVHSWKADEIKKAINNLLGIKPKK